MTQLTTAPLSEVTLTYRPRGAARDVFSHREPEVLLSGPAGTGKSRAILEKVHLACLKYPNARWIMLRKTRRSLTESGMVTFEKAVIHPLDGVVWRASVQQYQYPNGSILAVGGMDKPGKIMSSEWDGAYIQEATELTEADWEAITTRLRNGRMPYQQLLADCNPDAPTHWLLQRVHAGRTLMLQSWHEDNPRLYDASKEAYTVEGATYLAKLDDLTGVRKSRLRFGHWVAAEGMVYEQDWQRDRNLITAPETWPQRRGANGGERIPPLDWPRYLSVDFGFTNPFVCQWWAEDGDGRLYRYREIYRTKRLVEDHARDIRELSGWGQRDGEPLPRAIYCDHDAEDRATLERHLGLRTLPAHKSVSDGIQSVAARLRPAGDGQPRLYLIAGALAARDPDLAERKLPMCTEDEIESYIWDPRKEAPIKQDDHGCDCLRYLVATRDLRPKGARLGPRLYP